MKKGLLLLNGILGLGVIILFYLHFSNTNNSNNVVDTKVVSEDESVTINDSLTQFLALDSNISAKPIKIAYVNSDSLDKSLKMLDDVEKEIKAKENQIQSKIVSEKKRYENKFKRQVEDFETKRKNFTVKAPSMTDAQLQAEQATLGQLQQKIMGLEQQYQQELMMVQSKLENEYLTLKAERMKTYYGKVKKYCESIAKRLGFDFILIYQDGGAILYSNNSYDISKYVIEGINNEYDSANANLVID